ncbi:uncharacterized protein LOC132561996 [Ylistrum balloti]|uniref:uncharacterized protein LOC132561996 n=1 Tax=Ylistrum balloti TaxID=509963 RepID=UPI0029057FA8|nr:uncharacterized protein LOC132561996 [Ylistrum balloti]
MGLFQWILLFGVMDVTVSQNAAVTYQYPVCDKFHTYETEYKTGQLSSVNTYLFEGSHPSVQCTPISFNDNTCTHMDLNVTAAVHFKDFTLSVFIYPESVTDNTIFHYRSADFEQHFVLGVKNGIPYLYIYKNEILVSEGKMDQDKITITATTASTTCSPFNRNDSHFKKAHADRGFIPSINHLDEKINTTLRKCAVYCVRHLKCVSFTITKTEEEFQTCRLYDVYNKVYVENIATNTNMYVLNACH